jgi:hypothetical protein
MAVFSVPSLLIPSRRFFRITFNVPDQRETLPRISVWALLLMLLLRSRLLLTLPIAQSNLFIKTVVSETRRAPVFLTLLLTYLFIYLDRENLC